MSTEQRDGYVIRDRRGLPDEEKVQEICRVCGAPKVHTQAYNSPTMECIKYLRFQASTADEKMKRSENALVMMVDAIAWLRDTGSFFERNAENTKWRVINPNGVIVGEHEYSLNAISQAMQVSKMEQKVAS